MKEKLVLSVLVDNESGVLQRVASLFSRRAYNISSLTVSEQFPPQTETLWAVWVTRSLRSTWPLPLWLPPLRSRAILPTRLRYKEVTV